MKHSVVPCFLALVLTGLAAGLPRAAGETVNLRVGTILPSGTAEHALLQELGELWRKESGGTVKLTLYPDGRLGGEAEMVQKLRIKQLSGGIFSAVGLAEIDPSSRGLQYMPLMFHSWAEVDYVREHIRPLLEERLKAKGFEVLFWADAGWVRYFSKEPGSFPEDFKKMKMFVLAGVPEQVDIMRQLGYQPVSLEAEQILPGLTTGMISVVPVPPFLANALQFNREAKYMLDLNWVPLVGAAVIRRDVWERLSPALRTELKGIAEAAADRIRAQTRAEDEEAIVAMKKNGLIVQPVTPEVRAAWEALAERLHPLIRGTIVPAEIFDKVSADLAEYRATHGAAH